MIINEVATFKHYTVLASGSSLPAERHETNSAAEAETVAGALSFVFTRVNVFEDTLPTTDDTREVL